MLGMEEILCELNREDYEQAAGLPPGFRFHPTDEELITFYLASKVFNANFSPIHISEVDLNKCEPWELPEGAKMGEREWYFYNLRDRKYPTGLRTNRATGAGYWKATGKDREVYTSNTLLIGMKKTLVFYKGRAPKGEKTKWVMHEYRLAGDFSYRTYSSKEEWVICRIVHKKGEKKMPILYHQGAGQNYGYPNVKTWATPSSTVLPLVESTPNPKTLLQDDQESMFQNSVQSLHNFYLFHHQENDILMKSLFHNNSTTISQTNNYHFPMNNGSTITCASPHNTTKRYKENKQEEEICTSSSNKPLIQYPKTEEEFNIISQCQPYNNITDWNIVGMDDEGMMIIPSESHMDRHIKVTAESWPLEYL